MLDKSIQFKSFLPPCLTTIGGFTYVCPGWHKVPSTTTLTEVLKHWIQDKPKTESYEHLDKTISVNVKSSKGDKFYAVKYNGISWSCSCPAYEFRHSCRHIKETQQLYK